ncbi:MAG TPA: hypothetical protein VK191_15080 [Symbiobacteriaceae bacterium]|nr:hypothetical protein [Symbiobacteriaceae bacterium]
MRTLILVTSVIALLMYVGFAAQQGGATLAGAPLHLQAQSAPPVQVPLLTADGEPVPTEPRRFSPLAFLTQKSASCTVPQAAPSNAGR